MGLGLTPCLETGKHFEPVGEAVASRSLKATQLIGSYHNFVHTLDATPVMHT